MKLGNLFAVLVVAVLVSGCAAPARVNSMIATYNGPVSAVNNSIFKNNLQVTEVTGGDETNPMWMSKVSGSAFKIALDETLIMNGLSSRANPDPRFEVQATLSKLDQPMVGFNLTVQSMVDYDVVEKKTRKTWFKTTIISAHTATMSDGFVYNNRLKVANEGAIRENIRMFITELLDKQLSAR